MDYQESIFKVVDKFKARGLAFSLIKHASVDKKTRKLMVKNILKTEDKLIKKQISEELIVNRKLIPFIKGKNRFRDCAAYGKQITITPEGKVGICHHFWPDFVNTGNDTYMELDVNYKGKVKNHPTWVEWFNRTPLNMPQCWNCFGIGLCGGGCAKNSYLKKGSIWEIDDDICILVKEALPWVIWKYHEFKFKGKNNKKAI